MSKDDISNREAKLEHLREILRRTQNIQEAMPYIVRNIEITEWEIQALRNMPSTPGTNLPENIVSNFQRDYDFVKASLPMMPNYNLKNIQDNLFVTTSGTASLYNHILSYQSF